MQKRIDMWKNKSPKDLVDQRTEILQPFMSDIKPADALSQKSEVKPLQLPDEEWTYEKIIDELLCNLASVEQTAADESGQIIIIRKYQFLCRKLGRYIPVAKPTPEFQIDMLNLKPEVRAATKQDSSSRIEAVVSPSSPS